MKLPIALVGLVLLTLGCVPGGPFPPPQSSNGVTAEGLIPEAITVQPIESAEAETSLTEALQSSEKALDEGAPAKNALEEAPVQEPEAEVAPEDEGAAEPPPEPAPEPAPEPVPIEPEVPLSPQEAACLKAGNLWVRSGDTIVFACVRRTRDSGKQCTKGSDCDGECLARSRTCAPFDPLLGCNEILQDNGLRVTLCLN